MSTILVVDDEYDFSQALGAILEDDGYEVTLCGHGKEALTYLRGALCKDLPSVILLDTMMPHMDGFQLIGELRTHERLQKLPIILMAHAQMDIQAGHRSAFTDVLIKPFDIAQLLAIVHKHDPRRGWL